VAAQTVVPKDPADVLDYVVNWANWLPGGDTIATATFTVETGITKNSESNDATTATVWLSGGDAGNQYTITCTVTTTGGRTVSRSFEIAVEER
jgi:hypothetical protein